MIKITESEPSLSTSLDLSIEVALKADSSTCTQEAQLASPLAVELYRDMVRLRVFDERALIYHRHGRIGTWAISWGHEAVQVGAMRALRADDWAFPSYRENKIGLVRGMPPAMVLAGCRGHPHGFWDPHKWRIASISIPVASHVPHAVGFAYGEKLQGRDTVALAFFGDGATSEGEFHEAANLAGVMNAPVVLLCTNNQWAISTPLHKQTKARNLVDKALGYGIHGVKVDGNDVVAVYSAVGEAVERARKGDGPTFIECVTYRAKAHAFPDDPSAYRDDVEAKEAERNECLGRFAVQLTRQGLLTEEAAARFQQEAQEELVAAIAEAEALPLPGPELIFDHVYACPTPAMNRDLLELDRSLGKRRP